MNFLVAFLILSFLPELIFGANEQGKDDILQEIQDAAHDENANSIGEYIFVDTGHFLSSKTISKILYTYPNYGYPEAVLHGSLHNSTGYNELSLKAMPFFEHGTNSPPVDVMVYARPDVSTFYREAPGMRQAVTPKYRGQAAKFINMSPQFVQLYWDPGHGREGLKSFSVSAFESSSVRTYPGHQFYFALHDYPEHILCRFYVREGVALYVYDPFSPHPSGEIEMSEEEEEDEEHSLEDMDEEYLQLYNKHRTNLEFAERYKTFSDGAEWLSMYPRSRPRHRIWRADYFGQQHYVMTTSTHFMSLPPRKYLKWVGYKTSNKRLIPDESRPLQAYRSSNPVTNLTLTALSCAPRVFEVENFLSDIEVNHILSIAKAHKLKASTTGLAAAATVGEPHQTSGRTSTNTWLKRQTSPIVDTVFRRIADLLRVDESLLRDRGEKEHEELSTKLSIAESMQVVHYDVDQEYRAHFDFAHPSVESETQPVRYANIVIYLNDDMEGGEMYFPECINADTESGLTLSPKKGNAILYYSILPDGNMDELSQNGFAKVTKGEGWIANIFVWDPFHM